MTYSTSDIANIRVDDFYQHHHDFGMVILDVTLNDGTTYKGEVKINADDYKYDLIEDLNYDLGRKKMVKMEDMRDVLTEANYTEKDLKEFGHHVSGDEYCPPF